MNKMLLVKNIDLIALIALITLIFTHMITQMALYVYILSDPSNSIFIFISIPNNPPNNPNNPQGSLSVLRCFRPEVDSRNNFKTPQEQEIFNNWQRTSDGFYDLIRDYMKYESTVTSAFSGPAQDRKPFQDQVCV